MRRDRKQLAVRGAQGLSLIIAMCALVVLSFLGFQAFDTARGTSSFAKAFAELLEAKTISYAAVNDMPRFMTSHDYRWLRDNHAALGYYAATENFTINTVNWDPGVTASIAVTQPNPHYAVRYVLLRMCNVPGPVNLTTCHALWTHNINKGVDGNMLLRMCSVPGAANFITCHALWMYNSINIGVGDTRRIYRIPLVAIVRVQSLYGLKTVRYFDHIRVFDFVV